MPANLSYRTFLILLTLLAGTVSDAVASQRAQPVSPGSVKASPAIEGRCPTFIWSEVEGAPGYELVVYPEPERQALLAESLESAKAQFDHVQPVLRTRLPANVSSWTPPGIRCLETEQVYAWAVRPLGGQTNDMETGWSEPYFFEVQAAPTAQEMQDALANLERYLERGERMILVPAAPSASTVSALTQASKPATLGAIPTFDSPSILADDGVQGISNSATGIAGVFQNTDAGGAVLSGQNATDEVFRVDSSGTVSAVKFAGDGSMLTNLPGGGGGGSRVLVASDSSGNLPDVSGKVLSTAITVPAAGTLLITAVADVSNIDAIDFPICRIIVDNAAITGSEMFSIVDQTELGTDNSSENCSTAAVTSVEAGAHTVDLDVTFFDVGTSLNDGTLWVLWVESPPAP
jgi:hypothetical protein